MRITDEGFRYEIAPFIQALSQAHFEKDYDSQLRKHVLAVTGLMASNIEYFTERCPLSAAEVLRLDADMAAFRKENSAESLKDIYTSLFQFLVEGSLYDGALLATDLRLAFEFSAGKENYFSREQWAQIQRVLHQLPIRILKNLMYSGRQDNIITFRNFLESVCDEQQKWEEKFLLMQARINLAEKNLAKVEEATNFVLLNEAFKEMREMKAAEKISTLKSLRILAFAAIAPLLMNSFHLWAKFAFGVEESQVFGISDGVLSIASFSIFAVLMYYFRIILHDYKSLSSQLLQLDLRMALVQFVQKYSDYVADSKSGCASDHLARFESVIFSNIVPNGAQIPAVHDGLEDLAKLVAAVRK